MPRMQKENTLGERVSHGLVLCLDDAQRNKDGQQQNVKPDTGE